ncbi:MAG: DUF6435 family protein [Myxococcota bacterium]
MTAHQGVRTFRVMLGLFKKDPTKKLRAQYERLLAEANALQRSGDIQGYATKMAEAEELGRKIDDAGV